jgi:hypothetical protein
MAAAPFLTDLPVERPAQKGSGSHFDEPFIGPFLAKHLQWYRRRHSQAQPVAEAGGPSTDGQSQTRSSSAASEPTEEEAAAAAAAEPEEPELDVKQAEPLGKEEQKRRRRSSVAKALRRAFWFNGNE